MSMRNRIWLRLELPLLLLLLSGSVRHCAMAYEFDPLAPFSWAWSGVKTAASGVRTAASGVKTAASGVKTVVIGAADLTQTAYRFVSPTTPTAAQVAATAVEPPKSGLEPQGCFQDSPDKTPKLFQQGGSGRRMNKAKCGSKCAALETELFGLRSSPIERGILECWCGNSFKLLAGASEPDCSNRCPEEEAQTQEPCGGVGFMSVYKMAT